jgi:predicted Ser/Thr protein kinase
VWGRKGTTTEECPKSFITGQSLTWIEEFAARRRLAIPDSLEMEARKLDAFLILQKEMETEIRDGQAQH